jgi:hypothetical protein
MMEISSPSQAAEVIEVHQASVTSFGKLSAYLAAFILLEKLSNPTNDASILLSQEKREVARNTTSIESLVQTPRHQCLQITTADRIYQLEASKLFKVEYLVSPENLADHR